MTFQANRIRNRAYGGGDLFDYRYPSILQFITAARIEDSLLQADYEAPGFQGNFHFAGSNLSLQLFRKQFQGGQKFNNLIGWRFLGGLLRTARSLHLRISLAFVVHCSAQYFDYCRSGVGDRTLFESLGDGLGNLPSLRLVGLGRGEHDNKKGEKERDKVGV